MPPRQITSYFQKLPAAAAATATASAGAATAGARAASTSVSPVSKGKSTAVTQIPPETDADDAAERPAKRAKVGGAGLAQATGGSHTLSSTAGARAATRDQLREKLAANAKRAELLKTEVETMGEDWLLALQDELTKPYFLTVRLCVEPAWLGLSSVLRLRVGTTPVGSRHSSAKGMLKVQLKEFITAQQASKKVFPPADDVYSWSRLCPLKDVRVVIIGQDPYHVSAASVVSCLSKGCC